MESSQPTQTSSTGNSSYLESNDWFSSRSVGGFLRKVDAIFTCSEENGVPSMCQKDPTALLKCKNSVAMLYPISQLGYVLAFNCWKIVP